MPALVSASNSPSTSPTLRANAIEELKNTLTDNSDVLSLLNAIGSLTHSLTEIRYRSIFDRDGLDISVAEHIALLECAKKLGQQNETLKMAIRMLEVVIEMNQDVARYWDPVAYGNNNNSWGN